MTNGKVCKMQFLLYILALMMNKLSTNYLTYFFIQQILQQ